MFGKVNTNVDRSQPMRLQGDQLIYDKAGNRVIARGNVEIYYNNYILTADEVVYDQSAGTLTAVGNVTLKEPQGNVVHADRYTLTDDFRDGFVQSLVGRVDRISRGSPPIAPPARTATSPNSRTASSRPARATAARRRFGASARRASSTTQTPRPSPIRTPTSRSTASRFSTCPTSRARIRP